MGAVYEGVDLDRSTPIAIKVARWQDWVTIQRFMREAEALARIQHPGIVRYIGHGLVTTRTPYLVMEWLDGEDLGKYLSRTRLSAAETLSVGLQVAGALRATHRIGILHRDIKPSNLFLVDGDIGRLKLLDFGLAQVPDLPNGLFALTRRGELIGTPGFIAPELARGRSQLDERVDLYALGVLLFTCLTQTPPFLASHVAGSLAKLLFEAVPRVRDQRADVPSELDELIAGLMNREPERRPASADEVISQMRRICVPTLESKQFDAGKGSPDKRRFWSLLVIGNRDHGVSATTVDDLARRHGADIVKAGSEVARAGSEVASALLCVDRDLTAVVNRVTCGALELRAAHPDLPLAIASGRGESDRISIARALELWFGSEKTLLPEPLKGSASGSSTGGRSPGDVLAASDHSLDGELIHSGFEVIPSSYRSSEPGSTRPCNGAARPRQPAPAIGTAVRFASFLGRDRELAELESLFDRCVTDRTSQLVLVSGPCGAGKSRLRYELTRRLSQRAHPPAVWVTAGEKMSSNSPFGLVSRVIRRALGLGLSDLVPEYQKRLAERVCRQVASKDAERVAVFLGEIIDARLTDENHPILRAARVDSRFMREQLHWAWHDWLDAETAQQPVLIAVDDVQWGDLASLHLISSALRNLANRPLMVLATIRSATATTTRKPAEDTGQSRLEILRSTHSVHELDLDPLDDDTCRELVKGVLVTAPAPLIDAILSRAAGNPMHLEELLRTAARTSGDTVPPGPGDTAQLPATVEQALAAQIADLTAQEQRVLEVASVLGQTFRLDSVEALLAGDSAVDNSAAGNSAAGKATETCAVVVRLVRRGLLAQDWRVNAAGVHECGFASPTVHNVVYSGLSAGDRTTLHWKAGQWLEAVGHPDRCAVAAHYERSGVADGAVVPWLGRAAERALVAGDAYQQVLDLARRTLTCGPSSKELGLLSALQAEAYNRTDRHEAAYLCGCNAMDLLPRGCARWIGAARQVLWAASAIERLAGLTTPVRSPTASDRSTGASIDRQDGTHIVAALRALNTSDTLIGRIRGDGVTPDRGPRLPYNWPSHHEESLSRGSMRCRHPVRPYSSRSNPRAGISVRNP
ncbi:MAG: protein kinase [Proteobacteria bacterium]|nr:protein kinase [Pseudomonadota bacterium]